MLTESGFVKRYSQVSSAKVLFDFLTKHFPDGEYHAVYESGFSGFSTYYALKEYNIDCVVTHAADVPTTQYEEVMKTDRVDALKLARSLRADEIRPIYIRKRENIDDRSVVRVRKTIQKQLGGNRAQGGLSVAGGCRCLTKDGNTSIEKEGYIPYPLQA